MLIQRWSQAHMATRNNGVPVLNWWMFGALAAGFVIALVLGYWGFYHDYTRIAQKTPISVHAAFATLQLFLLRFPNEVVDPSWQTWIARIIAPLVMGAAAITALVRNTSWRLSHVRLIWLRNHTVIAGLNDDSLALATAIRRDGGRAVFLDPRSSIPQMVQCRRSGCMMVAGSATDARALMLARADRAARVVVMDEESSGVDLALRVGSWMARRGVTHRVHARVRDAHLYEHLAIHPGALGKLPVESIRPFHLGQIAARLLLKAHPLDGDGIGAESRTRAHLVVLGEGEVAVQVALQGARIGHYANGSSITLWVEQSPARRMLDDLLAVAPAIRETCEVRTILRDPLSPEAWDELRVACSAGEHQVTFVICGPSEETNLAQWLALPSLTHGTTACRARALVELSEREGLTRDVGTPGEGVVPAHFFDVSLDFASPQCLFDEKQDATARALHEQYLRDIPMPDPSRPVMRPWDSLPTIWRNANRQLADHIDVKLRAIGSRVIARGEGNALDAIPEHLVEALARCEHQRWMAERLIAGWRSGPRDDRAMRHDCLVPWEQLSDSDREKDRAAVRAIPRSLGAAGLAAAAIHGSRA